MAKDPTQGPVSTHDAEGNPIITNVDAPVEEVAVEETVEETASDESDVEEAEEEDVAKDIATPPDLPEDYEGGTEPVEPDVDAPGEVVPDLLSGEDTDFRVESAPEEQADVSVEGEPAAENVAQPVGEDPAEEIERAEVGDETEKMPEEESADFRVEADSDDDKLYVGGGDEAEFVTHEHEVKPPLTYNEAETMLMETSFVKLREMAIADGIKPERSRDKLTRQLLDLWFPAPTSPPADDEPEMSVRIRRAKGLM